MREYHESAPVPHGVRLKEVPIIMLALASAGCEDPLCLTDDCTWSIGYVDDTEPCAPAGETGGDAICDKFVEAEFDGPFIGCDGETSEAEHLTESAAHMYGVTDFALGIGALTEAGLHDFMILPEDDTDDPWSDYYLGALPGVVTHEGLGQTWAGYFGRACCPQYVVEGMLSALPESPTCASEGGAVGSWCLDMLEGSGLCVFPCEEDEDCPDPAGLFCDLSWPDPNGGGSGVCRFSSMPYVPTPHEEIGAP